MRLIFATHNQGKIKEMRALLDGLHPGMNPGQSIEVLSAEEAGVFEDVVEDGETFEENALKKARFVMDKVQKLGFQKCTETRSRDETGSRYNTLGKPSLDTIFCVADDSGICVEALGCFPGVHSARWLGEDKSGEELAKGLLEKIKDVPKDKRGAYFACVAVLVAPSGQSLAFAGNRSKLSFDHQIFEGRVNGSISENLRGKSHPKLPYDSIFIPDGYDKTFAEMSNEEKNKISHRGIAFQKVKEFLLSRSG